MLAEFFRLLGRLAFVTLAASACGESRRSDDSQSSGGARQSCTGGIAPLLCSGYCVDTAQDDANCGTCGHACTGAAVCGDGDCGICVSGCAVLGAAFDGATEVALYRLSISPPAAVAAGDTVTFRAFALGGDENATASFRLVYQGGRSDVRAIVLDSALGWQTTTFSIDPVVEATDELVELRIELWSNAAGPWATSTDVYLDSITSSIGGVGPWDFTASSDPLAADDGSSDVTPTLAWRGP